MPRTAAARTALALAVLIVALAGAAGWRLRQVAAPPAPRVDATPLLPHLAACQQAVRTVFGAPASAAGAASAAADPLAAVAASLDALDAEVRRLGPQHALAPAAREALDYVGRCHSAVRAVQALQARPAAPATPAQRQGWVNAAQSALDLLQRFRSSCTQAARSFNPGALADTMLVDAAITQLRGELAAQAR